MKSICMLAIMSVAAWATVQEPAKTPASTKKAAPKTTAKTPAKSTAKATPAVAPKKTATPAARAIVEIPKDAKEISPGLYRWVDPKGQAWIYNKTPFGLMSGKEPPKEPDVVPTDWKVFDEGDSLTFERPWPFSGTKRWTVKKTELTEMETAVWKRTQTETAKQ
ncbi:MAG: hypothetical protein JNL62_01655 [Bryobacterales bacterium]|nr:hypothetical protein [Bryobacterales bacterium]